MNTSFLFQMKIRAGMVKSKENLVSGDNFNPDTLQPFNDYSYLVGSKVSIHQPI
jgi:hypothetical protein